MQQFIVGLLRNHISWKSYYTFICLENIFLLDEFIWHCKCNKLKLTPTSFKPQNLWSLYHIDDILATFNLFVCYWTSQYVCNGFTSFVIGWLLSLQSALQLSYIVYNQVKWKLKVSLHLNGNVDRMCIYKLKHRAWTIFNFYFKTNFELFLNTILVLLES